MRNVTVAATQMHCTWELQENVARAEKLVRDAASKGAQIILI
ncbi:N-carbamoylputrescine amidase, partial [Photobacterium kishitanii]